MGVHHHNGQEIPNINDKLFRAICLWINTAVYHERPCCPEQQERTGLCCSGGLMEEWLCNSWQIKAGDAGWTAVQLSKSSEDILGSLCLCLSLLCVCVSEIDGVIQSTKKSPVEGGGHAVTSHTPQLSGPQCPRPYHCKQGFFLTLYGSLCVIC